VCFTDGDERSRRARGKAVLSIEVGRRGEGSKPREIVGEKKRNKSFHSRTIGKSLEKKANEEFAVDEIVRLSEENRAQKKGIPGEEGRGNIFIVEGLFGGCLRGRGGRQGKPRGIRYCSLKGVL